LTTTSATSSRLAVLFALAATLLAVALASPGTARAHGTGLPYHEIGAVSCFKGQVNAYPPRVMRSVYDVNFLNAETVHWTPELHAWNGSAWVRVATRAWYRAFTSSYGYYQNPYGTWQHAQTNVGIGYVPFGGLAPGYYAIKNFLYWNRTAQWHEEWSSYCYVS
jgi:hypothetical protein